MIWAPNRKPVKVKQHFVNQTLILIGIGGYQITVKEKDICRKKCRSCKMRFNKEKLDPYCFYFIQTLSYLLFFRFSDAVI